MNQDEKYPPRAPVPGIHALVYQQTNHNQCYGFFQEGPVRFLPSMAMTRPQTPQPPSSTLQYYGEALNCPQNYCVSPLPVGFSQGCPAQSLPDWTQNLSSIAMTSTQAPQPPPRTLEYNWNMRKGPQNNGTAGDMTACQLRNPSSSLPQGVAGASAHSSHKPIEDALQKREHRLMKNREAARASRKRRTEYMIHLQTRNASLETENRMLKAQMRLLCNPNIQIPCQDQPQMPSLLTP